VRGDCAEGELSCYNASMSQIDATPESPVFATPRKPEAGYRAPAFEVISLDCEITSYAPGGDDPLF